MQFGVESLSEHDPAQAEFRKLRTHHCEVAECAKQRSREEALERQMKGKRSKSGD